MLLYSAITFVCVIVFQHCCGVHTCVEFFFIFSQETEPFIMKHLFFYISNQFP